jgi:N-glycosylase/DNA lyase
MALHSRHRRGCADGSGASHRDARSGKRSVSEWQALWDTWGPTYRRRIQSMAPRNESEARHELVFCLLGGYSVSYELAHSAARRLTSLGFLQLNTPGRDPIFVADQIAFELAQPQFLPRTRSGQLRRYRYPRRKAVLLAAMQDWLRGCADDALLGSLAPFRTSRERRAFLCTCPGIGPKTASWFLRNVVLADDVAVLDVHVLRAMRAAGRADDFRLPRDYELLERSFLDWCSDLNADAAAFDLLLWECQRGLMQLQ